MILPLEYYVPNAILWTVLPYFASQAVFFVRVDMLNHWLKSTQRSVSQVGYSVLGLLLFFVFALITLVLGMLYALVSGSRQINKLPLAATRSAALSALAIDRIRD